MEIEAKFIIPDQDTMNRLQKVVRFGDYRLAAPTMPPLHVHDRYLDTPAQTLYQNGYACRIRTQDDLQTVHLKGLGEVETAIHQRVELETSPLVGINADLQSWPPGEVRERVECLIGDQPLVELFTVEQKRLVRALKKKGQAIAQISIDDVYIRAAGHVQTFWGLEVELGPDGALDDLHLLGEHLTTTWGLIPDPLSKFHRGMGMLNQSVPPSPQLGAAERAELIYIAQHAPSAVLRDRAQLILDWVNGVPLSESAAALGRSKSWAYTWLARFKARHMEIFNPDLIAQAREHSGLTPDGRPEMPHVEAAETEEEQWTLDELCDRFQVDIAHARRVADLALALFDGLATIHNLDPRYRPLLEMMGLLHNIGLETNAARHHLVGRDIVLAHRLRGVSDEHRRMIAASIYLHRKPFKPKQLHNQVIATLPAALQQDTLALAGILRIADGLDYTQGQTTQLDGIEATPDGAFIYVSGPYARLDAERAESKSDLWEYRFGQPVIISHAHSDEPIESAEKMPEAGEQAQLEESAAHPAPRSVGTTYLADLPPIGKTPGILPDDLIGEAGRKVLYFHFWRMLNQEAGTRAGTDTEALHDMRVAIRRMRSAIDLFGRYFKRDALTAFAVRLRRTARISGQVRDLDVWLAQTQAYLNTLDAAAAHDLAPLLELWQQNLTQARSKMLAYLDSVKYADFVHRFGRFLTTPGAGVRRYKEFPPRPNRVWQLAPRLIYARWARVQAFSSLIPHASPAMLHALRIECKRLRYTLEFFREVLGSDVEAVIALLVRIQDHLGNLHDADVLNTVLGEFLFAPQADVERVIAPGVAGYLAYQQRKLQSLIEGFGPLWDEFNQPQVRQWLANAVAAL